MLKVEACQKLQQLGCEMVLQVHDELLLEVPKANVAAAVPLVKAYMEEPFAVACKEVLGVTLPVDVKVGNDWATAQ